MLSCVSRHNFHTQARQAIVVQQSPSRRLPGPPKSFEAELSRPASTTQQRIEQRSSELCTLRAQTVTTSANQRYATTTTIPRGVTQCPLVRHQHDAARRKAKNHYYTLQRPFKATGGADLRTSQAHAHRCLGAPTVSERKKKKDLRESWRLTVSWCFPVRDPVP